MKFSAAFPEGLCEICGSREACQSIGLFNVLRVWVRSTLTQCSPWISEKLTSSPSRDSNGRFRSSGDAKAKPVQVWLKPDVLKRLDAYCAFYGVGRGRAIGHLLQGALPDPNWHPQLKHLIDDGVTTNPSEPDDCSTENRPAPRFRSGDRVTNNSLTRQGEIASEPIVWVKSAVQTCGTVRDGHWSYAVAWDGQMGLTIRYAEDLLLPAVTERHQAG